jgi:hypothetical protein
VIEAVAFRKQRGKSVQIDRFTNQIKKGQEESAWGIFPANTFVALLMMLKEAKILFANRELVSPFYWAGRLQNKAFPQT